MVRLGALIHVMAGIVFSGLFVLVLVYAVPRGEAPIGWFVAAAVAGWIVSIPFSWWFARRATRRRERAALLAQDRREFMGSHETGARGGA